MAELINIQFWDTESHGKDLPFGGRDDCTCIKNF